MRLSSTERSYGVVFIALHWTTAVMVLSMFALGVWMRTLNYVHPWYNRAPHLHESFGMVLFIILVFRVAWVTFASKPKPVKMPAWEHMAAWTVQKLLYLLLFAVMTSGFLITSADAVPIDFFNVTTVPPLVTGIKHQADKAGVVHLYLAVITVCVAGLHALAALKHHFIDKDRTLLSMLGVESKR